MAWKWDPDLQAWVNTETGAINYPAKITYSDGTVKVSRPDGGWVTVSNGKPKGAQTLTKADRQKIAEKIYPGVSRLTVKKVVAVKKQQPTTQIKLPQLSEVNEQKLQSIQQQFTKINNEMQVQLAYLKTLTNAYNKALDPGMRELYRKQIEGLLSSLTDNADKALQKLEKLYTQNKALVEKYKQEVQKELQKIQEYRNYLKKNGAYIKNASEIKKQLDQYENELKNYLNQLTSYEKKLKSNYEITKKQLEQFKKSTIKQNINLSIQRASERMSQLASKQLEHFLKTDPALNFGVGVVEGVIGSIAGTFYALKQLGASITSFSTKPLYELGKQTVEGYKELISGLSKGEARAYGQLVGMIIAGKAMGKFEEGLTKLDKINIKQALSEVRIPKATIEKLVKSEVINKPRTLAKIIEKNVVDPMLRTIKQYALLKANIDRKMTDFLYLKYDIPRELADRLIKKMPKQVRNKLASNIAVIEYIERITKQLPKYREVRKPEVTLTYLKILDKYAQKASRDINSILKKYLPKDIKVKEYTYDVSKEAVKALSELKKKSVRELYKKLFSPEFKEMPAGHFEILLYYLKKRGLTPAKFRELIDKLAKDGFESAKYIKRSVNLDKIEKIVYKPRSKAIEFLKEDGTKVTIRREGGQLIKEIETAREVKTKSGQVLLEKQKVRTEVKEKLKTKLKAKLEEVEEKIRQIPKQRLKEIAKIVPKLKISNKLLEKYPVLLVALAPLTFKRKSITVSKFASLIKSLPTIAIAQLPKSPIKQLFKQLPKLEISQKNIQLIGLRNITKSGATVDVKPIQQQFHKLKLQNPQVTASKLVFDVPVALQVFEKRAGRKYKLLRTFKIKAKLIYTPSAVALLADLRGIPKKYRATGFEIRVIPIK